MASGLTEYESLYQEREGVSVPAVGSDLEYGDDQPAGDEVAAMHDLALRLLSRRDHSRRELAAKLLGKGYPAAGVIGVLDDLAATGLQSDERMADAYVNERLRRGFGPLRIRQELRERGVAEEVIQACLDLPPGDWLALMDGVATRKFGLAKAGERKEVARRARFLEYRGFPTELIGRYLRGVCP